MKILKPFRFAFSGIGQIFRHEMNFRIHLIAAILVILLGIFLEINMFEWLIVVICIGLMLAAEAFNSSIEYLCDVAHPEHHPLIRRTKDAAAAGVLLLAMMSAIIGSLIFIPKLL